MGANEFAEYGFGRDVQTAFTAATEAARHEYGHGGYTGTLAEKRSYRLIEPTLDGKPATSSQIARILELATTMRQREPGEDVFLANSYSPEKGHRTRKVKLLPGVWYVPTYKSGKGGAFSQSIRKLTKAEQKLVPAAQRIARLYDDKWGPALAIQIKGKQAAEIRKRYGRKPRDKVFSFFGWASS